MFNSNLALNSEHNTNDIIINPAQSKPIQNYFRRPYTDFKSICGRINPIFNINNSILNLSRAILNNVSPILNHSYIC